MQSYSLERIGVSRLVILWGDALEGEKLLSSQNQVAILWFILFVIVNQQQIKMDPTFKITRHVPQSYLNQLQLVEYLVAIVDHKKTSQVIKKIKEVNQLLPLQNDEQYSFLKKVKKIPQSTQVKVLLSLHSSNQYKKTILAKTEEIVQSTCVEKLPKKPPSTKQHFKEWEKIWPIYFIEPQFCKEIKHTPPQISFLTQIIAYPKDFYLFNQNQQVLMEESGFCEEGTIDHPIMRLLENWPLSKVYAEEERYYLTNLRMLIRQEICGMCSMALVHSRLFCIYWEQKQVPGKMEDILLCKKLNHKVLILRLDL